MAIVLYKKGNSYTSPKGIRCQIQVCNPFSYEHLLEDGWFRTPEEVELNEKKKAEVKVEAETKVKVEAETKVKAEDKKTKVEDKKAKVEDKKAKVETEDNKAKIIKELKAKKAELLANQDKE